MVAMTIDSGVPLGVQREARWFYVGMAGIFLVIAFGGFTPTYWARLAGGSFHGAPILHIHGTLFFVWTLFFFVQTTLVALGRTPDHRAWGMAGISLATLMACSVVLAAINSIKIAATIGMADEARRFAIVSLGSVLLFALLFGAAIVYVKRPEVHKRLMLVAMIPLMHAATARVFLTLFAPADAKGPPPVFVSVPPALVVDLLLVAAMVYDWRTRGRSHPVYLIGGALLLANQLLAVPISSTPTWLSIARWVESLAG